MPNRSPTPVELPPEITVADAGENDVTFRFPRRQLGWSRLIGLPFLGVGMLFVYWVVWMGAGNLRAAKAPVGVEEYFMLGIGVLLAACAYFPIWLGLVILAGRREVTFRGGKLRTTERVGPLWRTKRWPLGKLRRVEIVGFFPTATPKEGTLLSRLDALTGVLVDGTRFMIVPGYPRRLLYPFADELARRCEVKFDVPTIDGPAVEVVTSVPARDPLGGWNKDGRLKPIDSGAAVDDSPEGITISLPPFGYRGGPAAMILFGGLAVAVAAVVATAVGRLPGWGALAVAGLGTVGLLVAIHGVRVARRRVIIAVVGRQLLILQTGLLRSQERTWEADELQTVRVGKSGITVNEEDILDLQVVPRAGAHFGLLAGRNVPEIAWIAGVLRQRLGLR
jgi:hypothetical protein